MRLIVNVVLDNVVRGAEQLSPRERRFMRRLSSEIVRSLTSGSPSRECEDAARFQVSRSNKADKVACQPRRRCRAVNILSRFVTILSALVTAACAHPNGMLPGCAPATIQQRISGYDGKTGKGIVVKLSDGHVYRRVDDTITTTDGIREPYAAGTPVVLCPPGSSKERNYTIAIEIVGRA